MSEANFWGTVKQHLGPYGRLERVENGVNKGTPDICYTLLGHTGWIELKFKSQWPVLLGNLCLEKLTLEQVLWQEDWVRAGGRACTLLQVNRDYLLLPPALVRRVFARSLDAVTLLALAPVVGRGTFPRAEVLKWLTRT